MRPKKTARKPAAAKAAKGGAVKKRPRKIMRLSSGAATLALAVPLSWIAVSAAPHSFAPTRTPKVYEGVVSKVIDGDTFYLDGIETRIRLWGLDAPERGERGGNAATRTLREIAHGKRVTCEEFDIDRYSRIVGKCTLADGGDVTALMIESGKAREYVRNSGGYYSAVKMASGN